MKEFPFLRLSDSNAPLADELKEAAARVIDSGWYLNGPETEAFARELSEYCGCPLPAITVSNGLDALRLILRAYITLGRLAPGDEVIAPANTYIASILPIMEMGLKPRLIDPSPDNFNLDLRSVEKELTPDTRAVILVHLYGNPCWNTEAARHLNDKGILLIEDNAQAIGALSDGPGLFSHSHMTGALGHAAAFSFYPTKNLGALGDAGAVTSADPDLLAAIKALANYGSDRRYHNIYLGYNCRMDELQAAFLRVKLRHIEIETKNRRHIARRYSYGISHPEITTPRIFDTCRQAWHQYPILCTRRDELRDYLRSHGVATDIHYATPPHRQPCMMNIFADDASSLFPITQRIADREISLPIANISPDDASTIAKIINDFR